MAGSLGEEAFCTPRRRISVVNGNHDSGCNKAQVNSDVTYQYICIVLCLKECLSLKNQSKINATNEIR
jgi:hypothetical protein